MHNSRLCDTSVQHYCKYVMETAGETTCKFLNEMLTMLPYNMVIKYRDANMGEEYGRAE